MNNLSIPTEQALSEIGFTRTRAGVYTHSLVVPLTIENRCLWNIAIVDEKWQTFFLTEDDLLNHLMQDDTEQQMLSRMCRSARLWWGGVAALHVGL